VVEPDAVLGQILFPKTSSAALSDDAQKTLRDVVDELQRARSLSVILRGHADKRGHPIANRRLAQRRADAAREFLVRSGISPDRVSTQSAGATQSVADVDETTALVRDRRVDIIISNGTK
jgi:outer membrane protein OmpA-like peptidoglycan-associated protein